MMEMIKAILSSLRNLFLWEQPQKAKVAYKTEYPEFFIAPRVTKNGNGDYYHTPEFLLHRMHEGGGFSSPLYPNTFPTVELAQQWVDKRTRESLRWFTAPSGVKFDEKYGYKIHGTSTPIHWCITSDGNYGIFPVDKESRKIDDVLPTLEALQYARERGDSIYSDGLIKDTIQKRFNS